MAGVRALGTNSRPTEGQVDLYRDEIYNEIGKQIGHGTVDSNNVARTVERRKVMRIILKFLNNKDIETEDYELTPREIIQLNEEFGGSSGDDGYAMEVWIPDDNVEEWDR